MGEQHSDSGVGQGKRFFDLCAQNPSQVLELLEEDSARWTFLEMAHDLSVPSLVVDFEQVVDEGKEVDAVDRSSVGRVEILTDLHNQLPDSLSGHPRPN